MQKFTKKIILGLSLFGIALNSYAQEIPIPSANEEPVEIPMTVPRSANQEPAGSITTFISAFRYDPQVDVQVRNLAAAQSDISIRGGNFDMTGINIGAATIYDPQTAHYTGNLPIAPHFLAPASVLTGSENALAGFNATAGSLYSGFSPAENWNISKIAVGDFGTTIEEINTDNAEVLSGDLGSLGIGSNFSHSSSNGTRQNGDSEFFRYGGRAQLSDGDSRQTDLLYTYQSIDSRWPNLYAPQELHDLLDSSGIESDKLDTALVLLNHRTKVGNGGLLEFTSYYKRNHNDYELDHFNKDLFGPYRNTSKVFGGGVQGLQQFGSTYAGMNAQLYGDNIKSSALTFGNYDSRTLTKISSYVGRQIAVGEGLVLDPSVGVSWDKSDRTAEYVSPISKVSLTQNCKSFEQSIYAEYAGSTQLPGYSALNANPNQGLFRGNKDLKQQQSANSELGYYYQEEMVFIKTALFYRKDNDATDWTYSNNTNSFTSSTANNIDIATKGAEIYGALAKGSFTLASSYGLLDKSLNYETEGVDASYYAANYPSHRITSALIAKPSEEIELKADIEFRKQYQDPLRSSEDSTYILSSISANYEIAEITGLNLAAIIDNIGNENFEEVPGVQGSGRIASFVATYVW